MCGCLSHAPYQGPGMCPNWESNRQPFGSRAGTQSTEPHHLGLPSSLSKSNEKMSSGKDLKDLINLAMMSVCWGTGCSSRQAPRNL